MNVEDTRLSDGVLQLGSSLSHTYFYASCENSTCALGDYYHALLHFYASCENFSRESRSSGSALVLLELSEATCRESSPSLETVVNVEDTRLSDGVLQLGSSLSYTYFYASCENSTCALGAGRKICQIMPA